MLEYIEQWLAKNILPALQGEGDALTRLHRMSDRLMNYTKADSNLVCLLFDPLVQRVMCFTIKSKQLCTPGLMRSLMF